MAFDIDNNGNITMVQGDTGQLVINGIPTDKNYTAYFAIQDEDRKPIGNELEVQTKKQPSIVFVINSNLTDLMTVKRDEETAIYYYGVKICSEEGFEDTLLIGDSQMGDRNSITVYPKKVEGCL